MADDHPLICYDLFNDIVVRLGSVQEIAQKQMLNYALPWVHKMDFSDLMETKLCQVLEVNS